MTRPRPQDGPAMDPASARALLRRPEALLTCPLARMAAWESAKAASGRPVGRRQGVVLRMFAQHHALAQSTVANRLERLDRIMSEAVSRAAAAGRIAPDPGCGPEDAA